MPTRVLCPFCQTAFDQPDSASPRATCPRCGESVTVGVHAAPVPSLNGEPAPVIAPAPPAARPSRLTYWSVGLTLLIAAGFGVWFLLNRGPNSEPSKAVRPTLAPATKPPPTLAGLKYIPRDAELLMAVQPSPLLQYAERTKTDPKKVMAAVGLPASLLDALADAGVPLDAIDHLVIAACASELWVSAVLVLREPLRDEAQFRSKLQAKTNADRREWAAVTLGGLPLHMTKVDDRTYLFAWKDTHLELAKQPTAGFEQLRAGVKESVQRLSPAAFVWLATDSADWSKVKGLELAATFAKQPDLPKKLDGYRAVVVGLSFEPDMKLTAGVRTADSGTAKALAATLAERLKEAKGEATATDTWADVSVPFDPPGDAVAVLRKLLGG